jgi:twinkle protein
MKIQSSNTKQIFSFEPGHKGEERHLCPECSHNRKKKTDKCLAWDNKGKRGYCHNCMTSFFEFSPHEPKQFTSPSWKNITILSDKAVRYFESRMISQKSLLKMRVYTDVEYMPQLLQEADVICFPYFFNNKLVNIKFRGPNKSFKLVSGAELIFWNLDCIIDNKEIIITEGEIDALTFIENGFNNVMSVPNGANKNLEYLDACIDLFKGIEKIYIASDQDTKGIELRDELVRRLGSERCYIVSFKDCKDANDYFQKYGDPFKDVIKDAKPVPVKGIIEASNFYADIRDLYLNGVQRGKEVGVSVIDDKITWETGRLAIVTGVPSSGKSEFVDYLVSRLNLAHGWKAAYFTPENYPLKYHYAKIFEKLIGKKFDKKKANELEYDMAFDYFRKNYFYILNDEDFTIKSILDSAKILVKTKGIKILVIDPFNKLEHKYTDSETQYISRFLDQIITFAKLNDILLFLIAHPVKMLKNAGKFEIPTLYSISGSANFYNKTDYGLTVHRKSSDNGVMINEIEVHVQKVKYKHLGEQGIIDLKYDYETGRFNPGKECDLSNWLDKTMQYEIPRIDQIKEFEFDKRTPPF